LKGKSSFLFPPSDLSACLFAAVVRDTRGIELSELDRFNFFPASPLVSITHVAEGEIRLVAAADSLEAARAAPPIPDTSIVPAQDTPTVSWCAGPALVVTVGIYPDAMARISDQFDLLAEWARAFEFGDDVHAAWARFCAALSPVWKAARGDAALPRRRGVTALSDWARALVVHAAMTGPGCGVRSLERRLKRWSGQTRRSLNFYAAIYDLQRLEAGARHKPLAELALDAGYSDQSHMGRAVRRATGFSPEQLNHLIRTKEAFWYYRLAGEQF
jgi:AraC-like DNA-binding protein